MAQRLLLRMVPQLVFFLSIFSTLSAERWSRQISQDLIEHPEIINDWIPLAPSNQQHQFPRQAAFVISSTLPPLLDPTTTSAPTVSSTTQNIDRSNNARVLAYSNNIYSDSNLQSAATQQNPNVFNFVSPFQYQRYQQSEGQKPPITSQQPTSQSFFKFEMPTFSVDGRGQSQPIQTGYQIQHTFGPAPVHSVITSPLFTSQKQTQFPAEYHSHSGHQIQQQQFQSERKPHLELKTKDSKPSTTANHENSIAHRPETYANTPQTFQKPTSFQAPFQNAYKSQEQVENVYTLQEPAPVKSPQEQEIQLLYVPYDTLYSPHAAPQLGYNNAKYNVVQQPVNPLQINNFYTQDPLDNRDENYFVSQAVKAATTSTQRPTTSSTAYTPITNSNQFLNPKFTTSKPKPKPHQPPLAMFLQKISTRSTPYDIVNIISKDKSVAVLDAPSKNAPQVFIGPSGLQAPPGYTKFELPYLSNFNQNNLDTTLKAVPFFVAPLSYKTPFGFSKIVLPEPHVGSLVINKPFQTEDMSHIRSSTRRPQRPQTSKDMFNLSPYVSRVPQSRAPTTMPKHNSQFQSSPSYEDNIYRQQLPEEVSPVSQTQKDFYNNPYPDVIKEVSSPKTIQKQAHSRIKTTTESPFSQTVKSRPIEKISDHTYTSIPTEKFRTSAKPTESIFVERIKTKPVEPVFTETIKPYAHFKPMPTNLENDEYFRSPVQPSTATQIDSETTSTAPPISRVTTTPRASIATTARNHHIESFNSNRNAKPSRDQQYFETTSTKPIQNSNVFQHKFQSKPLFDDEYRMKAYYRQQNINKNRLPTAPDTTVRTRFESVQYTPVSLDYDKPSSTLSYFDGSTLRTTTPRVTFYTPSYKENEPNNIIKQENDPNNSFNLQKEPELENQTIRPRTEYSQSTISAHISNNQQNDGNDVTIYNHDDVKLQENDFEQAYNLPSELPPLTPNLPGLVNALKENERLNAIEKDTTETVTTTTSTANPRTRKPIHRGRRPTSRTSTSSSVSYSSSDETITKKPINRPRRPYSPPTRNSSTATTSVSSSSSVSTGGTTRTSIRNPNRIRYNPTNEERRHFRSKTRKQNASTSKKNKENVDEDNLEYQRDVLKQNYPVFKHPTRKPFLTTTTEKVQEVVTVTPSTLEEGFPGLLEPMQIAQQYQHQQFQDNYGPGYFPNEEEVNPTEPLRNEIITTTQISPSASPTTTENVRVEITKRPAFIRRTRPSKTTEAPITTTTEASEKFTVRPRRPDGSIPRKVIKVRTRTRRPHPVSTTVEPDKEKENLQKVSKFNQDFYHDDYKNNEATYNRRLPSRQKFFLDTQETKWSPALSKSENFKPLNTHESEKSVKYDNDQYIVTAGPENQNSKKQSDTFEFNVSAGFGPSIKTYGSIVKTEDKDLKFIKKKTLEKTIEPTFEELLEQVMTDLGREVAAKKEAKAAANEASKIIKEEFTRQIKFPSDDKYNTTNRRGVWKKVRVTQSSSSTDGFETAESQNIGTQLFNSLYINEKAVTPKPQLINQSELNLVTTISKSESSTQLSDFKPEITSTINPDTVPSITTEEMVTSTTLDPNKFDTTSTTTQKSMLILEPQPSELSATASTTFKPFSDFDGTTTRFFNEDYEENENIGSIISRRFDQEHNNENTENEETVPDDLDTQPSLFDEVRSHLKNLFTVQDYEDDYGDIIKPNFQPRKHEYTTIQRVRSSSTATPETESPTVEVTTSKDTLFHKNLMKNVIFATSTSKEVSHETEICYRGRCIKSSRT
ncbi:mucin-2 [Condylostylus longicornis]|uniref:mucin-2 n=1 Tax=Condylostylus longicornis TaxID=2530218 RepID=UPI00244DA8C5|nr:mucin-2 [Condylostylus longicornis]